MAKVRYLSVFALLISFIAVGSSRAFAQPNRTSSFVGSSEETNAAIQRSVKLVEEVRALSYPELPQQGLEVKAFKSNSDFFNARFSIARYLTFRRLKTTIFINPAVFALSAPSDNALRAIVAHELAHALYYTTRNRLRLLSLMRLTGKEFSAQFERKADLVAISRGYGDGLIEYRHWLYENVPQKALKVKKRNYFAPDEIKVLKEVLNKDSKSFDKFMKKVPRTLGEIEEAAKQLGSERCRDSPI
jgi:hypothetical protein